MLILHRKACTHTESFYTEPAFIQRRFCTQKAFKLRKSADKSLSQPWCSHSNTIYDVQLPKNTSIALSGTRMRDKLPHPSFGTRFVLQNLACRASANSQKYISCETSLKIWKWKMWKRSFRARLPSKSIPHVVHLSTRSQSVPPENGLNP